MLIARSLDAIPPLFGSIGLTIGTFDGVHLGHQFLFNQLKKKCDHPVVLTFINHPLEVTQPHLSLTFLTQTEEKIALIEQQGIELLILLPFNTELASLTYRDFILDIRQHLPFSLLILGEDARLGRGRAGTPAKLQELAQELDFEMVYLKKAEVDGGPVSSQRIRSHLNQNEKAQAERLLGRPWKTS